MGEFMMFYAPFLVIIGAIVSAFWLAGKDQGVRETE
jgi:hypothetical protein